MLNKGHTKFPKFTVTCDNFGLIDFPNDLVFNKINSETAANNGACLHVEHVISPPYPRALSSCHGSMFGRFDMRVLTSCWLYAYQLYRPWHRLSIFTPTQCDVKMGKSAPNM